MEKGNRKCTFLKMLVKYIYIYVLWIYLESLFSSDPRHSFMNSEYIYIYIFGAKKWLPVQDMQVSLHFLFFFNSRIGSSSIVIL